MTKAKRWSYKAGERGRNRVRAYEDTSGVILVEFYECDSRGVRKRKRVALGHRDRAKAIVAYDELLAAFDHQRQFAATALFRIGECHRKQGQPDDASNALSVSFQTTRNLFHSRRLSWYRWASSGRNSVRYWEVRHEFT